MPIYDYVCTTCSAEKDELQKRTDPPPSCPTDEAHGPMKKVLKASSISMGKADGLDIAKDIKRLNPYYG